MQTIPPVSRIVVRPVSPKSASFTLTPSRLDSQNPSVLTLGRLTKVFASNLVESSPLERKKRSNHVTIVQWMTKTNPKVISPSLSLSSARPSLYETMAAETNPVDARASIGVGVCCVERLW